MKGISTLVVVILLLLISISVVGFVFIFFSRTVSTTTEEAGAQLNQTTSGSGKQLRIDNAAANLITVRHTGTAAIDLANEVTLYVNNIQKTCTWNPTTLAVGGTSVCTLNETCPAGAQLKITTPAIPATETCA